MDLKKLVVGESVLVTNSAMDNKRARAGRITYIHPAYRFAVVQIEGSYNESFFHNEIFAVDDPAVKN